MEDLEASRLTRSTLAGEESLHLHDSGAWEGQKHLRKVIWAVAQRNQLDPFNSACRAEHMPRVQITDKTDVFHDGHLSV